jgi:hypothetical protein
MFHLSCSVSVKRRRQNFVPDDQKSEYVFDVVPAGAVETGAEVFGCCTVFSSSTLHAPSCEEPQARGRRYSSNVD